MISIEFGLSLETSETDISKAMKQVEELLDSFAEASKNTDQDPFELQGRVDEADLSEDSNRVVVECMIYLDMEDEIETEEQALEVAQEVVAALKQMTLEKHGFSVEGVGDFYVDNDEDDFH